MPRTPPPPLPEWERVLHAAAYLQQILPGAVLVGGTASAVHARHRVSADADHVLQDLKQRFDTVLAQLESAAGWQTARVQRPVQWRGHAITLPTPAEMLRIKAVLILKRNATRDYLDFAAMCDKLGEAAAAGALAPLDRLYPQPNKESPLQQLMIQLANPLPYDLEETRLSEYKRLVPQWHDWNAVKQACARCATSLFDQLAGKKRR
jgi:hypothetical protein